MHYWNNIAIGNNIGLTEKSPTEQVVFIHFDQIELNWIVYFFSDYSWYM